ncbi:MAG TPA: orotate phosphoribosyltransferase [Acidimicrobiia bacterium]|nr:orotate phosphoribosyltransferase [Acidimicrobiia bacterium]
MRRAQQQLVDALRTHAIRTGEFTLASGRTSSWYVDGRLLTFRGDCVPLVGEAIVEALDAAGIDGFDAVGGLAIGADPVTMAVALATGVRGFAVRKEAKDHGVGGRIAGPLEAGDRVLVVDDTITTGGSLLQAVDAIVDYGARVVGAAALLDRGGEVGAALEERGVPFVPVVTAPDLGFAYGS